MTAFKDMAVERVRVSFWIDIWAPKLTETEDKVFHHPELKPVVQRIVRGALCTEDQIKGIRSEIMVETVEDASLKRLINEVDYPDR
jgi:hypothetical protein